MRTLLLCSLIGLGISTSDKTQTGDRSGTRIKCEPGEEDKAEQTNVTRTTDSEMKVKREFAETGGYVPTLAKRIKVELKPDQATTTQPDPALELARLIALTSATIQDACGTTTDPTPSDGAGAGIKREAEKADGSVATSVKHIKVELQPDQATAETALGATASGTTGTIITSDGTGAGIKRGPGPTTKEEPQKQTSTEAEDDTPPLPEETTYAVTFGEHETGMLGITHTVHHEDRGMLITDLNPANGPAFDKGIRRGSILKTVNGTDVTETPNVKISGMLGARPLTMEFRYRPVRELLHVFKDVALEEHQASMLSFRDLNLRNYIISMRSLEVFKLPEAEHDAASARLKSEAKAVERGRLETPLQTIGDDDVFLLRAEDLGTRPAWIPQSRVGHGAYLGFEDNKFYLSGYHTDSIYSNKTLVWTKARMERVAERRITKHSFWDRTPDGELDRSGRRDVLGDLQLEWKARILPGDSAKVVVLDKGYGIRAKTGDTEEEWYVQYVSSGGMCAATSLGQRDHHSLSEGDSEWERQQGEQPAITRFLPYKAPDYCRAPDMN